MQDLATHFSRNKRGNMLKFRNSLSNLSENSAQWALNGWSFIPLNGDLLVGREKAPALPNWKQFQHRRPSPTERQRWFCVDKFSAAGIVLGQISGVVVVDIDDPQTAQRFADAMPDLTQTFTVQSGKRGLPHYYYAIDGQFSVPNIRTQQIELRSDGSYVVAPDTVMGGHKWRVVNPTDPRKLTQGDLKRLEAFIQATTLKLQKNANTAKLSALEGKHLTISKLVNRYNHLASQIGRNNALFNCGCYARDRGWTVEQVTDALVTIHVHHPALIPNPESPLSRQREALRTIASVYQCPPRPVYQPERPKQLPNAVREALLQQRQGFLARVLDGLLLIGIQVGQWLNATQVVEVLGAVGIGRNTIYQALRVSDVFNPQTPNADADQSAKNNIKQCLFDSGTNRVQNQRGRPSLYFQMPSLDRLCEWLGVKNKGGDSLTLADVRTSSAYRKALYQAHIKRAPGAYSRQWQSQRLGICARTCRRYDRQCGVKVYPRYHETPIVWSNVETAISDEPIMGRFIMDETGRRYPENRTLAKRLLGMGRRLSLMAQGANYYQVEAPVLPSQSTDNHISDQTMPPVYMQSKGVIVGIPQPALSAHLKSPKTQKRKHKNIGRSVPLLDMSERLYQTLRAYDPQQSITKKTARLWTKTYGNRAVYRALKAFEQRKNIAKNPAGFMQILIKQNSSDVLKKNDATFQKRSSEPSNGACWERFLQSKYGPIFANYQDVIVGGDE